MMDRTIGLSRAILMKRIHDSVRLGEMSLKEAENTLAQEALGPLIVASEANIGVVGEDWWPLHLALAWILWRTPRRATERAIAYERWQRILSVGKCAEEPENDQLFSWSEGQSQLWDGLQIGQIRSRGRLTIEGEIFEIPSERWLRLHWVFNSTNTVGSIRYLSDSGAIEERSVIEHLESFDVDYFYPEVLRADIISRWPGSVISNISKPGPKSIENIWLPELERREARKENGGVDKTAHYIFDWLNEGVKNNRVKLPDGSRIPAEKTLHRPIRKHLSRLRGKKR